MKKTPHLFRGILKEAGYTPRERLTMHASGLTAYLAATAAIRYANGGLTNDWKEEAAQWGLAAISGWIISVPAAGVGYMAGLCSVWANRISRRTIERHKNLETQLRAHNKNDII